MMNECSVSLGPRHDFLLMNLMWEHVNSEMSHLGPKTRYLPREFSPQDMQGGFRS